MTLQTRNNHSYSSSSFSDYNSSLSTSDERIPSPYLSDQLDVYWEDLQRINEQVIRQLIVRLKLQTVPHSVPLTLNILPDYVPTTRPSYLLLAALAIHSSPEKKLKLSDIYRAIDEKFPRLIIDRPAYKRSLRHKLSLEPLFVNIKISSRSDLVGRGNFWILDGSRIDFPKPRRRKTRVTRYYSPSLSLAYNSSVHFDNYFPCQSSTLQDQTYCYYMQHSPYTWQAPHVEQWADHIQGLNSFSFNQRSHPAYLA